MMLNAHSLLQLGVLVAAAAANRVLDECLEGNKKYAMNVVLLEDDAYEWSRPFVQAAVERAIEEDRRENERHGTEPRAPPQPQPTGPKITEGLAGGNVSL